MTRADVPDPQSERDWQVFLYATDELSAQERLRFEERLADDQLLRESLARVVLLHEAVLQALHPEPGVVLPAPVAIEGAARGSRRAVVAVAAVCLATAAAVALFAPASTRHHEVPGVASSLHGESARAKALVSLWNRSADLVQVDPALLPADWDLAALDGDHAALDDSDLEDADVDDESLELPGWLVAAVSYELQDERSPGADELLEN